VRKLEALWQKLLVDAGNINSFTVCEGDRVVFERHQERDYEQISRGFDQTDWQYNHFSAKYHPYMGESGAQGLHTLQSATKSVCALVLSHIMELEGVRFDQPLTYFLPNEYRQMASLDPKRAAITLADALSMRSGVQFREMGVPYDDTENNYANRMFRQSDWNEFWLSLPMVHQAGTTFNYDSGASQLMALVCKHLTGESIESVARKVLFEPLGIERWEWKTTPTGDPDSQEGLYLSNRDFAKLGQLLAQDGVYDGKRVISSRSIEIVTDGQVYDAVKETGMTLDYGLQFWLVRTKYGHARCAAGYGGQLLVAIPGCEGISVALNAWGIFGTSPLAVDTFVDLVLACKA